MPFFFIILISAIMMLPIMLYVSVYFKEFNYNDIPSISPSIFIKRNIDIDIILLYYYIIDVIIEYSLRFRYMIYQQQIHRIWKELLSLLLRGPQTSERDHHRGLHSSKRSQEDFLREGKGATRLGIISTTGLRKHRGKLPPRAIIGNRRKSIADDMADRDITS